MLNLPPPDNAQATVVQNRAGETRASEWRRLMPTTTVIKSDEE